MDTRLKEPLGAKSPRGLRPAQKVPSSGFNSVATATPSLNTHTHINNTCARLNCYSRIPDAGEIIVWIFDTRLASNSQNPTPSAAPHRVRG